jgi:hypothetical protein
LRAAAQVYVAAHFSQPNTMVFAPALEWRRAEAAGRAAKAALRAAHAEQLAALMRAYLQVVSPLFYSCSCSARCMQQLMATFRFLPHTCSMLHAAVLYPCVGLRWLAGALA